MAQVTQPFNYLSMVQNPAQEALQAFQGAYQARQQQQQNEMFRSAFNEFARKPNKGVSDYVQLLQVTPPEMVAGVKASFDAMTEEQQGVAKRDMSQLIFAFTYDPERGKNLVDQRIEAARNAGDMQEVQSLQTIRKLADIDADSVVEALAMQGGMAFGDEFLKQIPGLAAPAEKKVQSTLRIPDTGTFVTVFTDGTSQAVDDAGNVLTGEARAEAIRAAQERGIEIQQARSQGREIGKFNVEEGKKALAASRGAAGQIPKLQRARKLVVDEGATTGAWKNRLPTFRDATLELQQIQKELGLDVVGSVTFGALSESELKLALEVALPTDLSGPALVDYIDRKIDAMQKYKVESEKLARYLLAGGNFADYVVQYSGPSGQGAPSGQTDRFAGFEIVEE
jgi:hypothetical protein